MPQETINRRALIDALDKRTHDEIGDEGFEHVTRGAESLVRGAGRAASLIPEGFGIINEGAGDALQELAKRSKLLSFLDPVGKFTKVAGELGRASAKALRESTDLNSLPGKGNFLTQDVMEGVGSALPTMVTGGAAGAAGLAGKTIMGLIASQGALMNGAAEYLDAELNGASEEKRWQSFFAGGLVGTSEAVGGVAKIAKRLGVIDRRSGGLLGKSLRTALESGQEFGQEWFQQVGSNGIAQYIRDEDRDLFEGAIESGSAGAGTAFLLSLIPGRKGRDLQTVPKDRIEAEATPYEPGQPNFPNDPGLRLGQGGEVGFLRREGGAQQQGQLEGLQALPEALRPIAGLLAPPETASSTKPAKPKQLGRAEIVKRLTAGEEVEGPVDQSIIDEVVEAQTKPRKATSEDVARAEKIELEMFRADAKGDDAAFQRASEAAKALREELGLPEPKAPQKRAQEPLVERVVQKGTKEPLLEGDLGPPDPEQDAAAEEAMRKFDEEEPSPGKVANEERRKLDEGKAYPKDVVPKIEAARESVKDLPFAVDPSDVDLKLANAAHAGTSHTPERRGYLEQLDYVGTMRSVYDAFAPQAKSEGAKAILKEEMERFQENYLAKLRGYLSAHGQVMSAMITGPSNFPTGRNQKRGNTAHKRLNELIESVDRAKKAIAKRLRGIRVEEAGGEVALLKKKVAEAEANQERMKALNKIVRAKKLTEQEKIERIQKELKFSEAGARQALQKDAMGYTGIPPYRFTNNLANIKRMRQRVAEMEAKDATPEAEPFEFEGGTVEESAQDNRIRIVFDDKPDAELREKLKARGFRWSPKAGAWQRQRTEQTRRDIEGILDIKLERKAPEPTVAELPTEAEFERQAIQEENDPARALDDWTFDPSTFKEDIDPDEDPDLTLFYSGVVPFEVPDGVKHWLRRVFRSRGNLDETSHEAKIVRDGWLQAQMQSIQLLVKDFDIQLREDFGKTLSAEQWVELDYVFKGEASPEHLTPALQAIIKQMRAHTDQLSQRMIDEGIVEGPLAARVSENMGYYATRTYKVFEDPKWAKKVPDEIKARYKALLLEGYILPERQAEIIRVFNRRAERQAARAAAHHRQKRRSIVAEATAELGQLLRDTKRAHQVIQKVAGAPDPLQGLTRKELGLEQMSQHAEANVRRVSERMARQLTKADDHLEFAELAAVQRAAERAAKQIERESRPQVDTEKEADVLIERILFNDKAGDNPISFIARGGLLGSKDLSILKRRKGLPVELRELLGENKSPRTNYANSVLKMAHLIANQRFLRTVREAGLGKFLFPDVAISRDRVEKAEKTIERLRERVEALGEDPSEENEILAAQLSHRIGQLEKQLEPLQADLAAARNAPKEAKKQIAAEGSDALAPLNGLWTFPEYEQALRDSAGSRPIDIWWLRGLLKINAFSKIGKTVGSPMTHMRNLTGNTGFAVANAHFNVGKAQDAWQGIMGGLRAKSPKEWRAYWLKAVELGVVQESTHSGEVRDLVKDAHGGGPTEFLHDAVERNLKTAEGLGKAAVEGARAVGSGMARLYALEDDVWKLYAWENEKARYRKARPDWSETELERRMARIVADTYPTYSRVPLAIRELRRIPWMGNFVSFPYEVIRVGGNTIKLAYDEMQDPRTRSIGVKRTIGIAAAASLPAALAAFLRYLQGIGEEEDEAIRTFLPPWSKNSTLLHIGKNERGNRRYIDFSYTDPYSYLKKPLTALLRGEVWDQAVVDSALEFLDPFISEEIVFNAVVDILRNRKTNGGKVYNEADSWAGKAGDIAARLGKALEPGALSSGFRIKKGADEITTGYGKVYDLQTEVTAATTGVRVGEVDLRQGLSFLAGDYQRFQSGATSLITGVATREGKVSEAELVEAYEDAEAIRRDSFEELAEAARAAVGLGFTRAQVYEALNTVASKETAERAISGRYKPYMPSSSFMREKIKKAPPERRAEFERRREIIKRAAAKQKP